MTKKYEDLLFTDDFMFCKILTTRLDLAKELLELLLEKKIREVKLAEPQKTIEITANAKGVRLDVYLEDNDNTVYNIEMQTTTQKDIAKRARYYQGMIDLAMIEKGAIYDELKTSYVIFICLNDPFGRGDPVYIFENRYEKDPAFSLGDECKKVFVNPRSIRKDLPAELGGFLDFLLNGRAHFGLAEKLERAVEDAKEHLEWRREYMLLIERDKIMRRKGREEGLAEGLAEGLTKGVTKGWTSAFQNMQFVFERKMKYPHEDAETVSRETGCPVEEVKKVFRIMGQM